MDTAKNITIVVSLTVAVVVLGLWLSQGVASPQTEPTMVKLAGGYEARNDFTLGGVTRYSYSQALTQGASTTCSFQTPAATSTLTSAGVRFTLASTSEVFVEIGKALSKQATTTLIGTTYDIAAGVPVMIVASTSPVGGAAGAALVFPPSAWLNVKIGGGGALSVPTGTCNASFEAYP